MVNNYVLIKKKYISKHRVKKFVLQEKKVSNLLYLTKNALKRTSNATLNMKTVDLDEL